jgi:SAM-dependent methyltransferase
MQERPIHEQESVSVVVGVFPGESDAAMEDGSAKAAGAVCARRHDGAGAGAGHGILGAKGRVVAVDVQEKMLSALKKKARKAGLLSRIDARLVPGDSMQLHDLAGSVDFTLAYAVVHEIPSCAKFFLEAAAVCRNGAQMLLVEPAGHVSDAEFEEELRLSGQAGFAVTDRPSISRNLAAVLKKE